MLSTNDQLSLGLKHNFKNIYMYVYTYKSMIYVKTQQGDKGACFKLVFVRIYFTLYWNTAAVFTHFTKAQVVKSHICCKVLPVSGTLVCAYVNTPFSIYVRCCYPSGRVLSTPVKGIYVLCAPVSNTIQAYPGIKWTII